MAKGQADNDIYVTLNYLPLGLIGAKANELWRDGICVDTGAVSLPYHSEVELTLSYRRNNRLQVYRIAALVTERNLQGTQLTFMEAPPETASVLQDLERRPEAPALEGVA